MILPRSKKDIFAYKMDYSVLEKYDINERTIRGWLEKKMVAYLGNQEDSMIALILALIGKRVGPNEIMKQIQLVFEEKTEEFVMNLWKALIFEDMKGREGLLQE